MPLKSAVAIIECVSVIDDAVTLHIYVSPDVRGEYWPVNLPCVKVDARDETGTHYEARQNHWGSDATGEGRGDLLVWPPVASDVKRLRVKVSTLWEAAWAEIDLPGR